MNFSLNISSLIINSLLTILVKELQKFVPPVTGFTHVYTPNDYMVNNNEALELHDSVS